jgi:DNA-directed RNA polymerase specialized sigma24 family protein
MKAHPLTKEFRLIEAFLYAFAFSLTRCQKKTVELLRNGTLCAHRNYNDKSDSIESRRWWCLVLIIVHRHKDYRLKNRLQVDNDLMHLSTDEGARQINGLNDKYTFSVQLLKRMLASLDPVLSVPFMMAIRGHSSDKIAESLKVPVSAIEARIKKANEELMTMVRDYSKS